jgi:hypothetical protein
MPSLFGQIQAELSKEQDINDNLDSFLSISLRGNSKFHKESIHKEYKRREEKKREEFRIQKEREEQKRRQKEERARAREKLRVNNLLDKVSSTVVNGANVIEGYEPKIPIYDVRDPNGSGNGIFLVGGFTGELMLTLQCLYDYILANPQN